MYSSGRSPLPLSFGTAECGSLTRCARRIYMTIVRCRGMVIFMDSKQQAVHGLNSISLYEFLIEKWEGPKEIRSGASYTHGIKNSNLFNIQSKRKTPPKILGNS